MISAICAICGKNQKIVELYPQTINFDKVNEETFSARRTPDRMHYRLVKCIRCGLIFSNPILEPKKIDRFYQKSFFSYSDESEYLKKTYRYYFEQALKKLNIKNIRDLKVLEIGCGNGFFLDEIKNNLGIESIYGAEPSKSSVDKAPNSLKKRIKVSVLKSNLFKNNSFDVICCFHTLDHITDPNDFLKICYQLLKKDGIALFIVHNTDGLSVRLFGEKSPIFDIEHIYLFNPKSLNNIFEKNKFEVNNIFDVKNTYPSFYWFRMIPLPKIVKSVLLKILDKTGIGKIPLSISPGNIGIIAEKNNLLFNT